MLTDILNGNLGMFFYFKHQNYRMLKGKRQWIVFADNCLTIKETKVCISHELISIFSNYLLCFIEIHQNTVMRP